MLDKTAARQGIKYTNIEPQYLLDLSLRIEYKITATNTSEVDWTGEMANLTSSNQIADTANHLEETGELGHNSGKVTYGKYVGLNYYTNKYHDTDNIVKTNVEQIIDYIDNDISLETKDNMNKEVKNHSWKNITVEELKAGNVLANAVYTDGKLIDRKNVALEGTGRNNIVVTDSKAYNESIMKELVPESASELGETSGFVLVSVAKNIDDKSDADDLMFDNMAEIIRYTNTVGRRDMEAVPGNAEIAEGAYEAGEVERDADSADMFSIFPPTGLDVAEESQRNYAVIIAIAAVVMAAGVIVIKKFVVDRK